MLKILQRFVCVCDICSLGPSFMLTQDERDRRRARQLIGELVNQWELRKV
jgi:hypothetical protein